MVPILQRLFPFALAGLLQFTGSWAQSAEPALPALGASQEGVTVSGLSSGAYMAVQMHVAYSSRIKGAGLVAGGPYYCAQGLAFLALNRCMETIFGPPDGNALASFAKVAANAGKIDPVAGIADSKVYVFGGTDDPVVKPPVVQSLVEFYQALGVPAAQIATVTNVPAGHTFPTENFGAPCSATQSPYISNCGVDVAGSILSTLYGSLQAPVQTLTGRLMSFHQGAFLPYAKKHGMDDTALAWIPKDCEQDASSCKVHVAFHGCLQGRERLGEVFASLTGYNRWADANKIIVLYPQAVATSTNPNGCWDWFAYDDETYYTKNGRQMHAVIRMVDRLQQKPAI